MPRRRPHRFATPRRLPARLTGLLAVTVATTMAATIAAVIPAGASTQLSLVAYSTPRPAYTALIQAFEATKAGRGVAVAQSYGASGAQSTAVVDGLQADVVNFSLTPDMTKLVKAGLVSPSWDAGPTKGIVSDSVVAFVVRRGNPKHIATWADLVKPGVQVITPNPFSSGAAQWNLVAAYGAQLHQGQSKAAAQGYLAQLLHHTVAQPTSAATALEAFNAGEGDVLLDYEADGLYAQRRGEPVQVVVPPQTILIQNPIALTTSGANSKAARAFEQFLFTPAAQAIWAKNGYRPVLPAATGAAGAKSATGAAEAGFPRPKAEFTIDSLGGWTSVRSKFFNPTTGVVARDEQSIGVSTGG